MQLVRLKRLGVIRFTLTKRSLVYHRTLQILPFMLVVVIFTTLLLITIRQTPKYAANVRRFPINAAMGGVMLNKYQQHLKLKNDQPFFRIESLLQRDAPSVESSNLDLLRNVAKTAIAEEVDNNSTLIDTSMDLPPCISKHKHLFGPLVLSNITLSWDDGIENVTFGGEHKPQECLSDSLVAVVIPFRDRMSHLVTLLHHLHPILQRQLLHYKIFVVEQDGNDTFNKGAIMNAAFKLILQEHSYPGGVIFQCFVFHDVDLLMEDDRNMHSCPDMPRHLSVAVDELGYKLPYRQLVGGVFIIRTEHFLRVNGYSNLYWGWGGEDDDMGYRVEEVGLNITRPPIWLAHYTMIKHSKRVPLTEVVRRKLIRTSRRRYRLDGLNTLKFEHIETKAEKYYTKIIVSVGTPPKKIQQLQSLFEKNRKKKS